MIKHRHIISLESWHYIAHQLCKMYLYLPFKCNPILPIFLDETPLPSFFVKLVIVPVVHLKKCVYGIFPFFLFVLFSTAVSCSLTHAKDIRVKPGWYDLGFTYQR